MENLKYTALDRFFKVRLVSTWLLLLVGLGASGQTAVLKGKVTDVATGEALPFVNILLPEYEIGGTTDLDGNYSLNKLPPGPTSLEFSFIGYKPERFPEIVLTNNKPLILNIELSPSANELDEVVVVASAFEQVKEDPVSIRSLGIAEIERNPGGNRDVSKVVQSLPGVSQGVSFRNDLIIRGGGPNENAFYLDDVRTPNFNHFATQGASGGPVGLIDVNYVRGIDLSTSSFPSFETNALSSVLNVKYREPRDDRVGLRVALGASDLAIGGEGPLGEKTRFLASYRRSYLQFLFKGLGLPFLPTYNDLQYKITHRPNENHEVYTVFLGALDKSRLNRMEDPDEFQSYLLSYLPEDDQWSYTQGVVWKMKLNKGYMRTVLSRNMLRNTSTKFTNNDREGGSPLLNFVSDEAENRARIERKWFLGKTQVFAGMGLVNYDFELNQFRQVPTDSGLVAFENKSKLNGLRYSAYANLDRSFAQERVKITLGLRAIGDSYNANMEFGLDQILPSIGLRYNLSEQWVFGSSMSWYQQTPAYTTMGFGADGVLLNQDNLDFIKSRHMVTGISFLSRFDALFSVEVFQKNYQDYPVSLLTGIALANLGGDFGVVGLEPVRSSGQGRVRGLEFLYQQKAFKGFFGIFAYTLLKSEFRSEEGEWRPSSWDARHTISATAGKRFKNGWEMGAKLRFSSGNPYTPYDIEASSQIENYDANPLGILDYSMLNANRFPVFNQVDVRVDKKWYTDKLVLNLYVDIQNLFGASSFTRPILLPVKDANGNPLKDPNDPSRYQLEVVENESATVLPTLGVILEF